MTTERKWTWRDFGGGLLLVTEHEGSRVVLSANKYGDIVTRDAKGRLVPLTANDPIARLIAAAPQLADYVKKRADNGDEEAAALWRLANGTP